MQRLVQGLIIGVLITMALMIIGPILMDIAYIIIIPLSISAPFFFLYNAIRDIDVPDDFKEAQE